MPGQPAPPAVRAGRSRLRGSWFRTRRMAGGVLADTGPLRRHRDFRRLWGAVAGPAAAGLLIAHAGFGLVYGLDLASFGVALVTVVLLPRLPPDHGGQPAGFASLIGGITHMWSSQPRASRLPPAAHGAGGQAEPDPVV